MQDFDRFLSRRRLLGLGAAVGGIALTPRLPAAQSTPHVTQGPFYPVLKPLDQDGDLTHVAGRSGRAQGELIHLSGRVLDAHGRPVEAAVVEIWQADSRGRYIHPRDANPAAIDADFQGYGKQTTDEQGRYRFKTVKPAPYPAGGAMRTPHVHMQVTSAEERKITQMFFPGEPLNENDFVLRRVGGNRDMLFARIDTSGPGLEPGSKLATFDVVLG